MWWGVQPLAGCIALPIKNSLANHLRLSHGDDRIASCCKCHWAQ